VYYTQVVYTQGVYPGIASLYHGGYTPPWYMSGYTPMGTPLYTTALYPAVSMPDHDARCPERKPWAQKRGNPWVREV